MRLGELVVRDVRNGHAHRSEGIHHALHLLGGRCEGDYELITRWLLRDYYVMTS